VLVFADIFLKPYLGIFAMVLFQVITMVSNPRFWKKKGKKLVVEEAAAKQAQAGPPTVVFLEVRVGDEPAQRIVLELLSALFPKTSENFRALCTGEKGKGVSGKPLHYKGATIHRAVPGFVIQGGDTTSGNGTGGECVYAKTSEAPYFDDEFEGGIISHSGPFLLSMANVGEHSNGSQFFVTTAAAPHLDGKNVVFGRVVSGQEVVRAVEAVGTRFGPTRKPVTIVACGALEPRTG